MIYHSKISNLYFYNNSSLIPDGLPGKAKLIWIPDVPESEYYVTHLLEKYKDRIQNCFMDKTLDWMILRLKASFPGIHFSEIRSFKQNTTREKTNQIFLYPQSDTLADSLLHIYTLLPPDKTKIITPRKASEGTEDYLNSRKIPFKRFSLELLREEKPDVMVFLNDWTKEVQQIIAHCRRLKIATICLQESVIDFGDHFKRMQHTDYAFVQGSQTTCDLNRDHFYITGNPRYENLKRFTGRQNKKVIINCNFTYKIYETIRYSWLDGISETLDYLGMDYMIIQHPRDMGDLSKYRESRKTNSATVHDMLSGASVLITRFSSLIHEAIIMGIPVIYFNPHHEKMKYGFDFNQSFIQLAENKEELRTGIEKILQQPMDEDERNRYIIRHCFPVTIKPSVIISELLLNYYFKPLQFSLKDFIKMIIYHPAIRRLYVPFVSLIRSEKT